MSRSKHVYSDYRTLVSRWVVGEVDDWARCGSMHATAGLIRSYSTDIGLRFAVGNEARFVVAVRGEHSITQARHIRYLVSGIPSACEIAYALFVPKQLDASGLLCDVTWLDAEVDYTFRKVELDLGLGAKAKTRTRFYVSRGVRWIANLERLVSWCRDDIAQAHQQTIARMKRKELPALYELMSRTGDELAAYEEIRKIKDYGL
jgi:hypothetical protein